MKPKIRTFKVEIRKTCSICGEKLGYRQRTYCSKKCRNKALYRRNAVRQAQWQRDRRDKEAEKSSPNKIPCLVCGKWYVQVCSHVQAIHGMTGREYREYFDLEVKRGVVPAWYRKVKGDQALENETYKNLKVGKKFWFKPGDPRAGKYQRSPVTLERLHNLHKLNKHYANN